MGTCLEAHEMDAANVMLAGYLYLKRKTELLGDPKEGTIVVPKPRDWRILKP